MDISGGPDPGDGEAEFFDLWLAKTTDDLRRVLVLHPPVKGSSDAFEPFLLLSKHHEIDPTGSAVTAMLMVTDRRWRGGVGNLIRRIEGSGILDDDELDLLAEAVLAADDALYWEVPDGWFSDEGIVIWVGGADETEETDETDEEDDRPAVARREVVPPLRRWAAGRLVGRQPERWSQAFSRARDLDARGAAAAVAGLLDVIGVLGTATQELLVEEATRWPNHSVRRLGIGLVAERKGAEAAHAIAVRDPNAGIRAWAGSLLSPPPGPGPGGGAEGRRTETARTAQAPEPPTLF